MALAYLWIGILAGLSLLKKTRRLHWRDIRFQCHLDRQCLSGSVVSPESIYSTARGVVIRSPISGTEEVGFRICIAIVQCGSFVMYIRSYMGLYFIIYTHIKH
jgi:hypothetical protein